MGESRFEPAVVVFCCWWCSYGAADLAGASKMSYPPNVRIVRVPCSGRVDLIHILRAFLDGADGVMVTGCLKDGCHYVDGNLKAERRVNRLKELLDQTPLGGDRLEMRFMSAAESNKFVEATGEFVEKIRRLGESPLKKSIRRVVYVREA